jgi:hypothetical protein
MGLAADPAGVDGGGHEAPHAQALQPAALAGNGAGTPD